MKNTIYMLNPPDEQPYIVFPNLAVAAFRMGMKVTKIETDGVGGTVSNPSAFTKEDEQLLVGTGKVRLT